MNLKHLTDKTLLIDTKKLVHRERDCLTEILHHLREIERRRLFSALGCSSLFDYCLKELGYSEGSAHRRIQASRLLADIPEIEDKLETGVFTLSTLGMASQFFNQNEIKDLDKKRVILKQLENLTQSQSGKKLFEISGHEIKAKEQTRRLSKNTHKLILIVSDEVLDKITEFKGLIGKNLSKSVLFDKMLDISIQHVRKKKFKS